MPGSGMGDPRLCGGVSVRSLWKGAISFGLVHIPCRLYPATNDRDIHFRQLHAACHTPIEYHKVCPRCGDRVSADAIVRGYPVGPDGFVLIGEEELASLPLATTHTVEIVDFVDLSSVDPLFFEKSYFIGPADGGGRPYALLRAVLQRTGHAAVAKVAIRAKESLALVRVVGQCLTLELMYYPDEIRDWHEVDDLPGDLPLPERELDVATRLVESMTGPWRPEQYHDHYREALHELVAAKSAGERVQTEAPEHTRYADLLAALEASVREAETRRAQQPGADLQ